MCIYGYCRISTKQQSIDRQIRNIKNEYSTAVIATEAYSGTTINRPEWNKLYKKAKAGDTIVFDSVSRIFTDIETSCSKRFHGYEVWANVNKEINTFLDAINQLQENGFNIVLIAHAVWDENAKKYIETCKGSFAKIGGFLSTVDYAMNIDILGNKRILTHRGNNLSRTLLDDIPEKEDASNFNLQTYLDKIKAKSDVVSEKWSI